MKRWTVMLIPGERGATCTLNANSLQIWFIAVLVISLSFTSAFLFRRHQLLGRALAAIGQENRRLAVALDNKDPGGQGTAEASDRVAIDRIRTAYEQRNTQIEGKLTELVDLELQVREILRLPPRETSLGNDLGAGGKGGPPGDMLQPWVETTEAAVHPRSLIYGLSRPSADLILQEISLRKESLKHLLVEVDAQRDRFERMPSIWPVFDAGRKMTSRFGYRQDPFHRKRIDNHTGTDVSVPRGTPVVCTARGKVISSEYEAYYGNLVRVDHGNGIETWYAHLSERLAKPGDQVERGAVIGRVGMTGRATGPHVHYEIRVNDRPVDAERFFLK